MGLGDKFKQSISRHDIQQALKIPEGADWRRPKFSESKIDRKNEPGFMARGSQGRARDAEKFATRSPERTSQLKDLNSKQRQYDKDAADSRRNWADGSKLTKSMASEKALAESAVKSGFVYRATQPGLVLRQDGKTIADLRAKGPTLPTTKPRTPQESLIANRLDTRQALKAVKTAASEGRYTETKVGAPGAKSGRTLFSSKQVGGDGKNLRSGAMAMEKAGASPKQTWTRSDNPSNPSGMKPFGTKSEKAPTGMNFNKEKPLKNQGPLGLAGPPVLKKQEHEVPSSKEIRNNANVSKYNDTLKRSGAKYVHPDGTRSTEPPPRMASGRVMTADEYSTHKNTKQPVEKANVGNGKKSGKSRYTPTGMRTNRGEGGKFTTGSS